MDFIGSTGTANQIKVFNNQPNYQEFMTIRLQSDGIYQLWK
ncbi:hypothetical protein N482_18945 [Pseudoalteromonas luteoviolacea NCIMB 1942]|uniref:Uncharacterized protein n=1 Tax=Pseudoalteromonas luteoviolacea NCIMB 1942 TaxID=1365253 RepID=A0A166Z2E5_9GAMM|nr:hypothetical protein N482_18945 [Pseudoalteromonas luteoviolacea NCIMB 1942]